MSTIKTTAILKKLTAIFLAVIMCILLVPTAEAAGSTLSCSAYNPTINAGKSGALLITATGNKSLTASVSNSDVLSYKWDTKWSSDTSIKLFITGKKAGTSKIYIKNGKSETMTINVTVKSNDTPKQYGTTSNLIKADTYNVYINKGGLSTVKVTSANHSLVYKVGDSSVASVTAGKWSGNTVNFKIKGLKAGTTYLTVYRKSDKNVAVNIKITVGGKSTTSSENSTKPSTQKPSQDTGKKSANVYWDPVAGTYVVKVSGTWGPDSEDTSGGNSGNNNNSSSGNYAEQMLALVNQARAEAGAAPLTLDSKLCDAADKRAEEITTKFSHTRPNGTDCFTVLNEFGISCYGCGENIAMGSTDVNAIFNMWMNSSGHRANILNPNFKSIGIGKSGVYWVQLFLM